jgi:hypothetical protein
MSAIEDNKDIPPVVSPVASPPTDTIEPAPNASSATPAPEPTAPASTVTPAAEDQGLANIEPPRYERYEEYVLLNLTQIVYADCFPQAR